MDTGHNHPPACCCQNNQDHPEQIDGLVTCPVCPHHGELAQLGNPRPGECPICHSEIGKQHTDYCQFTGTVSPLPVTEIISAHLDSMTIDGRPALSDLHTRTGQPATTTSQPTTHARSLHVDPNPHPTDECHPDLCGRTPLTTPTPGHCICGNDYDDTPAPGCCPVPERHDHPR